jgi:hypothetical protein
VSLGLLTAAIAIGAVLLQLSDWSRLETFRLPPVSQIGFFVGIGVFSLLAVVEGMLALRSTTTQRAIAMTAIGGALAIQGAIGAAAGSQPAVALFYAGAVGLAAGIVRITEGPRRLVAAVGGVLGSALVSFTVDVLIRLVSRALP